MLAIAPVATRAVLMVLSPASRTNHPTILRHRPHYYPPATVHARVPAILTEAMATGSAPRGSRGSLLARPIATGYRPMLGEAVVNRVRARVPRQPASAAGRRGYLRRWGRP